MKTVSIGSGDRVLIIGEGPAVCMHIQFARARGAGQIMVAGRTMRRLKAAKDNFNPDAVFATQGEELERMVM